MKRKYLYWFIIIFFTIVPIVIDSLLIEKMTRNHPFIWSLFLIPSILLINMYPKWRVIIGSAIFFTLLKFITELFQHSHVEKSEITVLTLGSIINWSIHLTIGYFIFKSHKLLLQVKELSITDALTGIYNRRYFDLFLEKTIAFSRRTDNPLSIMVLDIDHFKKLNDTYGHLCGDEALKHLGRIIKNNVRDSDAYVRFGGEEFAIILPTTSVDDGKVIAERIRAIVEKSRFQYKNKSIKYTVSIGLAQYKGEKPKEFVDNADKALYRAKQNGRNQIEV